MYSELPKVRILGLCLRPSGVLERGRLWNGGSEPCPALGLTLASGLVIFSRMEQLWPNLHCEEPWAGGLEALLGNSGFSSCSSWAEPESADHSSGGMLALQQGHGAGW